MRALTVVGELTVDDLRTIVAEAPDAKIVSDMDFLETLAALKCIVVPPWILKLSPDGKTSRITRLTYDAELNVNKPRVLLKVMQVLKLQPAAMCKTARR